MNNIPNAENPNCQKCELHKTCKTPFMEMNGENPRILVVGEAPGAEEDEQGIPFVGASGKLLRKVLEDMDFNDDEMAFTNVVRCRPPDNKISKKAIDCCKGFLLEEIEEVNPELVLLMGNTPLKAVLNESGITTWNGVTVKRDERVYVPLFHPAYILRNNKAMEDWLMGFIEAEELLESDDEEPEDYGVNFQFPKTVEEVQTMYHLLMDCDAIAFDTETSSLDPFGEGDVVIALSFHSKELYGSYAFPYEHPETWFNEDELDVIYDLTKRFFEDYQGKIVGHNLKYDQLWTAVDFDAWFKGGGDCMLASHLLDSRSGIHSLKRLAGLHLGMFDYDRPISEYKAIHKEADPEKGGSYANIPLKLLLPYAALDAYATANLFPILYDKLTKKQQILHDELIMQTSDELCRMQHAGVTIDYYIADRYATIYGHVQNKIYEELLDLKSVKKTYTAFQEMSDVKQMRDMMGLKSKGMEISELTYSTIDMNEFTIVPDRIKTKKYKRDRKRGKIEFNPDSADHVRYLYYTVCKIPTDGIPVSEKTGKPTTSYGDIKHLAKKYPIIEKIKYYKLLSKMIGTYLEPAATREWASGDGKVRSNYNQHGTITGRPSSSNPNLMNIPTPEKEPGTLLETLPIKNIFTHSQPGGLFLAADYSGMELRVMASVADCEPMLEIHRSGRDFHKMVASMISGIPYDDIDKPTRYIYKWTNWTLFYGGGAYTLHSMYGIPLDEAERAVKLYYDRFPEVKEFQSRTIETAQLYGYAESPFGRRAKYPYINDDDKRGARDRRSAINMPIQSAASDITNCAIVVVGDQMRKFGLESKLVNTVYDSIAIDVWPGEIHIVASLCKYVMENVLEYGMTYFPHMDFSWLKSPLKADVEVGSHYGAVVEYEDWCKVQGEEPWQENFEELEQQYEKEGL